MAKILSSLVFLISCAIIHASQSDILILDKPAQEKPLGKIDRLMIGVDVGGTNTDAVLLNQDKIIAHFKTTTTEDITTGVVRAIAALFKGNHDLMERVNSINIGTTQLLNSLLERKGLNKPLVVRLAAPATTAVPPAIDWDPQLKKELLADEIYIINGGYEFNGTEITALDLEALNALSQHAKEKGIDSIAITGVFSNVNPSQEEAAKAIFKQLQPSIDVSLSHTMGELGLSARENATILDACLTGQYRLMSSALKQAVSQLGIKARVFLTYGDGTKDLLENGSGSPLRTANSGIINSLNGGALLAGVEDAIMADIGGTSSDFVARKKGKPVNENSHFSLAGVNCNFGTARLYSIGLGGGSIIRIDENGNIHVGPHSVGKDLMHKALVYAGDTLTPTDIAVALGRLKLGTLDLTSLKEKISRFAPWESVDSFLLRLDKELHQKLSEGVLHIVGSMEDIPKTLVLVGGGASLFSVDFLQKLLPYRFTVSVPPFADVANAVGAAKSLICGKYVKVYDYTKIPQAEAILEATQKAKIIAHERGADPKTSKVVTVSEIPLTYLKGDPNQLTVSVVGEDTGNESPAYMAPVEPVNSLPASLTGLAGSMPDVSVEKYRVVSEKVNTSHTTEQCIFPGVETLTTTDIDDIAWGAGLLGSGGGGNPELGRQMALYAMKMGGKIQRISVDNLPDDAFVVDLGGMGSPTVSAERPPSREEGIKAIQKLEEKLNKKVTALVLGEAAGANATDPLFVAAALGIPVVDCDCMGRAFPKLNMTTTNIYGTFKEFYAGISNGVKSVLIQAKDFSSLEDQARAATIEMGGAVTATISPMTGAQVKKWTIKGTLSIAQAMGKALRLSQGEPFGRRLEALNKVLATTDYEKADRLFEGKIVHLRRKESDGFSIGGFIVDNQQTKEKLTIGFENENLIARQQKTGEILAIVPDLITIVDKNTFRVISCEDLRYGQDVVVLKMRAPALMRTEAALAIVGPHAYPMEQIFALLDTAVL